MTYNVRFFIEGPFILRRDEMSRDTCVMCNALITIAASQTRCHVKVGDGLAAVSDLILDVSHVTYPIKIHY